jgi:hypothetical protein
MAIAFLTTLKNIPSYPVISSSLIWRKYFNRRYHTFTLCKLCLNAQESLFQAVIFASDVDGVFTGPPMTERYDSTKKIY